MTVLVTGGLGYIGSHVVWNLLDAGKHVIVLDDHSTGHVRNVCSETPVISGDIADETLVRTAVEKYEIDSIVHMAAKILPFESIEDPLRYYDNNVSKTISLLRAASLSGVEQVVFSSTAAVYGNGGGSFVSELSPTEPLSPYGYSKLMAERILASTCEALGMRATALRYFNVAGADADRRCGPRGPNPGHLVRTAMEVALGKRECLSVFGSDYATPDGTAIRDYIHVSDLASAHVIVLDLLKNQNGFRVLNCGYGHGRSVLEVIAAVESVVGRPVHRQMTGRRAGDPEALVADITALRLLGDWAPAHDCLEVMVQSLLPWI